MESFDISSVENPIYLFIIEHIVTNGLGYGESIKDAPIFTKDFSKEYFEIMDYRIAIGESRILDINYTETPHYRKHLAK